MSATMRGVALAGALLASPVWAQTTPEQYLGELQSLYAGMGYKVEIGTQEKTGDALVAKDVTFSVDSPDLALVAKITSVEIKPTTEAGWELQMVTADPISITLTPKKPDEAGIENMQIFVTMPGNLTLIGGTPEERRTRMTSDSMAVTVPEFVFPAASADPAATPGATVDGKMTMAVIFGKMFADYTFKQAAKEMSYTGSAEDMKLSLTMTGPDAEMTFSSITTGLTFEGEGMLGDMVDPAKMFSAENGFRVVMTQNTGTSSTSVAEGPENFQMQTTTGAGVFAALIGGGQIDYGFEVKDTKINLSGTALGFPPADLTFASFGTRFAMPMMPSDKPGQMMLDFRMEGLGVSEALWAMFDPAAAVPRDPATLILRVTSKATALVNMFDTPAVEAQAAAGTPPFRLDDVTIDQVTLKIGGAEVNATGSAILNNDGPFPMPVGGVDVKLDGVLGLLEKLQTAGVIPPEQAAMLPAMLQTFAKPGDKPDTFTSRLEMTAEGGILANGVPLQ